MKSNELLTAYIEQSRMVADLLKANLAAQTNANPLIPVVANLQGTIDKMQATLDRIVTAQYDRPVERTIQQVPKEQMGLWNTDQGDGAEDIERIAEANAKGLAAIEVESDEEFLRAAKING